MPAINVIEGDTFGHDDEGVFIYGFEFQLMECDVMSILIMGKKMCTMDPDQDRKKPLPPLRAIDVQAQTILKVKFLTWLSLDYHSTNDIFGISRIWFLVSGKEQKNVLNFHDNC